MRYIPQIASEVVVQIPEDKNAYINVRNVGASGRGDIEFTGLVSNIDDDGVVTISNIFDETGNTIYQYQDLLKSGVELQVFGYASNTGVETGNISISGHQVIGNIDFSSSQATNPNVAELKYFVFGYDVGTGSLPSYRSSYIVRPSSDSTSKVLNPDLWNSEQYIQLLFTRTSSNVVPVIYRAWGARLDFLGVIGNNKVGYPGSGSIVFRDLGSTEIPSWENSPELPSFMQGLFSVGVSDVTQTQKIIAKETLEILPINLNTQVSYLQCRGLSQNSNLSAGDTIKFRIDDTKYIQQAINTAAIGAIKEVFLPAGVYNIRDTYFRNSLQTDYSNISMRGVGDGSIIRRLPSTVSNGSNAGLLNFTGYAQSPRVAGIRIRAIALDGNRLNNFSVLSPQTSEVTLKIENADNVVIADCSIYDNAGAGIEVYNTNGASILSNKIIRTGRSYETGAAPLLVDTSESLVIQGNILEFATTSPKIISTEFSTINSNIVRGCGDQGFLIETSAQWNAQGNVAYSDNDSIIRSIDTYNNEYSRATIEVRKGFALDPIYMTVTYGGQSIGLAADSIQADIFQLNSVRVKSGAAVGAFRVLQTADQLEAGIFSLTLPGGTTNQTIGGKNVLATGNLNNEFGYMYEVKGSAIIGKFRPFSIRSGSFGGAQRIAIKLQNPSDMLGFQIYSSDNISQNDKIYIRGFSNTDLQGWSQQTAYAIVGLDVTTNSILLNPISGLTLTSEIEFLGGTLSILRSNYFIADGNIYVHSL